MAATLEHMKELKLPSLGEGIAKGTIISIAVKVGDVIEPEQFLMEVETDKVVVEIPSDLGGTIAEILLKEGDEISQGVVFMRLTLAGIATSETRLEKTEDEKVLDDKRTTEIPVPTIPENKPGSQSIKALKLSDLGEGIEKGAIVSIAVKVGDTVKAEQLLMEVETDKVVVEIPADTGGTITEILVNEGEEISVGTLFMKLRVEALVSFSESNNRNDDNETKTGEVAETKKEIVTVRSSQHAVADLSTASKNRSFRASPLARKTAKEIGLDISQIQPKRSNGRISVQDVKDYARQLNEGRQTENTAKPLLSLPDFNTWGTTRREKMSGIMQATSKNMSMAWSQIPHAWLQEKVDITYLEKQRQANKAKIKAQGGALTITGILVKVVAKALQEFPIFNSSADTARNELVFKDYINIGVAADTERGLVVPVLKNADTKNITEISIELGKLSQKARERKISADELSGATFTISNLGGIGTTAIFPIVNFPQVAILGVAASCTEAVWIDGQFQPKSLMPLTIGFDHRVINGADAARFLQHVKSLLEDLLSWNL